MSRDAIWLKLIEPKVRLMEKKEPIKRPMMKLDNFCSINKITKDDLVDYVSTMA